MQCISLVPTSLIERDSGTYVMIQRRHTSFTTKLFLIWAALMRSEHSIKLNNLIVVDCYCHTFWRKFARSSAHSVDLIDLFYTVEMHETCQLDRLISSENLHTWNLLHGTLASNVPPRSNNNKNGVLSTQNDPFDRSFLSKIFLFTLKITIFTSNDPFLLKMTSFLLFPKMCVFFLPKNCFPAENVLF